MHLLKPVDISGTLFGGAFGAMLNLASWLFALSGLLIFSLLRLSGYCAGWIVAGLLQMLVSSWWLINYPDNETGDLIFSVQKSELASAFLIALAMFALGLFLQVRANKSPQHATVRPASMRRVFLACMLAAVYTGIPLKAYFHTPLPHCAFDKQGQQLSVCLDADDKRIIVD